MNEGTSPETSQATDRLTFPKARRLRTTAEFRECFNQGQRAGDSHLLVFAVRNELGITRIGLSVSKKHGNAVKRNRKKRLLREAFRLQQHVLPAGLDLVLVPRQRTDSGLGDFVASLRSLAQKLDRRIPPVRGRQTGDGS